jgi:hypothetical protein
MKYLSVSMGLILKLALPAHAATYYASPSGSGTACSQASPCALTELVTNRLAAGDIGIVNPGTYSEPVTASANGTSGNRITLKAVNYAVNCADPMNDPDGCTINTNGRSILNSDLIITGNYWTVEGFQFRHINTDGAANGILRYSHGLNNNRTVTLALDSGTSNQLVEHSYFVRPTGFPSPDDYGDYGIRLIYTNGVTIRNIWCGSTFNHCISSKRGDRNITIERVVCEGWDSQCIFVGQEMDDDQFGTRSPTSCPNTLLDDGTTGTVHDSTIQDVTIRNVFGRFPTGGHARGTIMIDNARDVDIQNVFSYIGQGVPHGGNTAIWIRNDGAAGFPGGRCGIERGNISIQGLVSIASQATQGCVNISSMGESPSTVTIENMVCHGADEHGDPGVLFSGEQLDHLPAWETSAQPATTIRNSVLNNCTSAWTGQGGAISFTQSHNNFFNCGTSPGGTGAQTTDPQFVGPESVPTITVDSTYLAHGEDIWDWAGRYQPIIDRFDS